MRVLIDLVVVQYAIEGTFTLPLLRLHIGGLPLIGIQHLEEENVGESE